MIILRAWIMYEGRIVIPPEIVDKWPDNHQFPFKADDPREWLKWLSYGYKNGSLARKDKNGHPIRYMVNVYGGRPGPKPSLFPGYDDNNQKRDFREKGKLLPPRE